MYGFNKVGALFTAGTYPKPVRGRLYPVLRCFSSRHRRRRSCETRERKLLPLEISKNTVKLTCESFAHGRVCNVYLVGTNHISTESAQQVKAVIEFLKPQAVFLELCASRLGFVVPLQKQKEQTLADLGKQWRRTGNFIHAYLGWFDSKAYSNLQIQKSEFCVAYEEATKCGARVFYGDRDIKITMARVWAGISLRQKTLLMFKRLFSAVYVSSTNLDKVKATEALIMPTNYMEKALVDERDQYMSAIILNIAQKHNSVVAVVGKNHLRGIQEHWKKPVNVEELLSMPQKKRITVGKKILTCVGVAVAGVCGIYLSIKI